MTKHPYIFIAYFIAGVNSSLFDFTYTLAKEVLPNMLPSNYQNMLYLGSIIIPIALGMLADKKGIFNTMLQAAVALIIVNFIAAILFKLSIKTHSIYFILAFIEGGLAISAATLSASLIGERLKTQGIFRSFAMSGMLFSVGYLCAGRIYEYSAGSFALTKLCIGLCNLILLALLWKSYTHDPTAAEATE